MLANAPIPPLTAPAPLTDYVLMPKRLTAENGAKGALSGEFKESIRITCHECDGSGEGENNEDCIECKGEGTVDAAVTVGWDTIKDIYKAAVALLAKAAPAAPVQTAETLEIVETVRTAMRRAYSLGQTYWQQADSEYTSQNKKADVTAGRFIELIDDTCAKVESSVAAPVQAEQAQAEPAFWYDARAKLEKMDLIDGAHQAHLLVCNERFGDYTTPLYHAAPALPAQAEQAEAVRADYSIRPVKVERDENGWWTHPAIPNFDDDHKSFAAWVKAVGLETKYKCLESYPEHPLYDAWFEHGECNASSWEPEEPAGEGWFTFSIHDTEDGPVWVWARALAAPSTATSNDTGALGDTGGAK
jgi:hypothetical protein